MRVLLINEYVESRGAEQILHEQMHILKQNGHDVKCICFSYSPHHTTGHVDSNYEILNIPKYGKFLFLPLVYLKIRRILQDNNPDIVLLHNIFSSPRTVYKALAGYSVFQVVHDYKVVCPTGYCALLNSDCSICKGFKDNKCCSKCTSSFVDWVKMLLRLQLVKINEKLRKKYVKKIFAPSSRLCQILQNYGYNCWLLNNPIRVTNKLHLKTKFGNARKVLYVGGIIFEKGILPFSEKIMSQTSCILDVYGGIDKNEYSEKYLSLIKSSNKRINYYGKIEHTVLMEKIVDYDFVIVPSLWVDNYPTIILEAMAHGVIVIASNRGGAVDLLSENRGFLFDWDDELSINKCLDKIESIEVEEYNSIIKNAYVYVLQNNSYETYYRKLTELL